MASNCYETWKDEIPANAEHQIHMSQLDHPDAVPVAKSSFPHLFPTCLTILGVVDDEADNDGFGDERDNDFSMS